MAHYYNTFCSSSNNTYRVDIYDITGTTTDLKLESNPVTVNYQSDNLYQPLKLSGISIKVITQAPLTALYTGENQAIKIKLTNITSGLIEFYGYLTPCAYNQAYNDELDTITLEGIDTLSSLNNIKYSLAGGTGSTANFITFRDLILNCLNFADSNKVINNVYFHKTLKVTSSSSNSIFDRLCSHEGNFYDELKDSMSLKEVLEETLKYLGLSMLQYKDSFYIYDYEFIKNGYTEFVKWNRTTSTSYTTSSVLTTKNLYSGIGIAEASGSLSIGDVYNKVSLTASFNKIDDIISELFDENDIVSTGATNEYSTEALGATTYLYGATKSLNNWQTVTQLYGEGFGDSKFSKQASFKTSEGEPASISWTDYLTAYRPYNWLEGNNTYFDLMIKANKQNNVILKNGYLILDLSYAMSNNKYVDYPTSDEKFYNGQYSSDMYDTRIAVKLKIGSYYWTGTNWRLYADFLTDLASGYYTKSLGQGTIDSQYKYWYTTGTSETKYYITVEEYDTIRLQDKFFVTHTNVVDQKIFNTWYKLDNQVSYTLDLLNSKSGYLIKLPENTLFGTVEFELYSMDRLGNYICNRTDKVIPPVTHFHIKDLSLMYTNNNFSYNIFTNDVDDSDMIYENELNSNNVNELDSLELKVNTYTKNINSLSNVALKSGNGTGTTYDLLSTLYSPIEGGNYIPEQLFLNKLINYYSSPKFIYSNILNRSFHYLDKIYESTLNKTFLLNSMSIDYESESASVELISI